MCSLQNGRFAINSIIRLMDRSEMYTAELTAVNKKYNHRMVAIRRFAIWEIKKKNEQHSNNLRMNRYELEFYKYILI